MRKVIQKGRFNVNWKMNRFVSVVEWKYIKFDNIIKELNCIMFSSKTESQKLLSVQKCLKQFLAVKKWKEDKFNTYSIT